MKKNIRIWIYSLVVIGAFLMLTGSCKKSDNNPDGGTSSGTVKDIDGNVYHTVTIGTQVWMVENLRTTKYRNGDAIPLVTDNSVWPSLTTGAACNYNDDATLGNKYGKFYNGYALKDKRNIAPTGWHIPSYKEWITLNNYLEANLGTSGSVAKILASKTDWVSSNNIGAIGNDLTKNNSSGFNALPSGFPGRSSHGDPRIRYREYFDIGYSCRWWSYDEGQYNVWILAYDESDFTHESYYDYDGTYYDSELWYGFSIRCIKD